MTAIEFRDETFRDDFSFRNSPAGIRRFPFPFHEDRYMYAVNIEPHTPGPIGTAQACRSSPGYTPAGRERERMTCSAMYRITGISDARYRASSPVGRRIWSPAPPPDSFVWTIRQRIA